MMQKVFFSILFIFIWKCSFAQNSEKDISINLSNYSFAYNLKMKKGSNASGLTMTLNTNGKFMLEFGLLIDFKKYLFYEGMAGGYQPTNHLNLFLPLLGHYNYYENRKLKTFLSCGFILGGQNTITEENRTKKLSGINFLIGT